MAFGIGNANSYHYLILFAERISFIVTSPSDSEMVNCFAIGGKLPRASPIRQGEESCKACCNCCSTERGRAAEKEGLTRKSGFEYETYTTTITTVETDISTTTTVIRHNSDCNCHTNPTFVLQATSTDP